MFGAVNRRPVVRREENLFGFNRSWPWRGFPPPHRIELWRDGYT
jgi:hypothetical protein